ncbi:unnamed protein product [Protopolystoma xenopodis]|uniref:Uncharacterized protein n=1 Tax=Protopolystoma xenopodis TaxID=117903 RepID=A0A3S5BM48_9PLAT|nr:unnamed protein product [Protopolystoma xenopodis]
MPGATSKNYGCPQTSARSRNEFDQVTGSGRADVQLGASGRRLQSPSPRLTVGLSGRNEYALDTGQNGLNANGRSVLARLRDGEATPRFPNGRLPEWPCLSSRSSGRAEVTSMPQMADRDEEMERLEQLRVPEGVRAIKSSRDGPRLPIFGEKISPYGFCNFKVVLNSHYL